MTSDEHLKQSSQSTSLEYTGERHIAVQPGVDLSLSNVFHMIRYALVSPFVKGKRVLDVACGSGYGTQYMALQGASQVVGIDVDESSIDYAFKFHSHHSVSYVQSDAHFVQQLEDASFDVIVSFETIEHVQRPRDFLVELRRLLKPEGQLFISCPNDYRVSPWLSEFHIHKFRFIEFRDLFLSIFGEATFVGQHDMVASCLLKPIAPNARVSQFEAYRQVLPLNFFDGQYLEDVSSIENADGYLAIFGIDPSLINNQVSISQNAYLVIMRNLCFTSQIQAELEHSQSQWQAELEHSQSQWQAELEHSQSQLQSTQAELEHSQSQLQSTQAELEHSQSQLQQSQAIVAAMQTSKVWKLQAKWFKVKKVMGLITDD